MLLYYNTLYTTVLHATAYTALLHAQLSSCSFITNVCVVVGFCVSGMISSIHDYHGILVKALTRVLSASADPRQTRGTHHSAIL